MTVLSVIAFFSLTHFMFYTFRDEPKPNPRKLYKLTKDEKSLLQTGDIVLRKGYGFASNIINDLFPTGYSLSHCAFVYRNGEKISVIHSVSSELSPIDGVQSEDIDKFIRESIDRSVMVVRYKADSLTRQQFGDVAKAYLNKGITFDSKFELSDTTEFYCSELIYRVFYTIYKKDMFEERLTSDHPDFLGIDAFLDTTKFDIILSHQQYKKPEKKDSTSAQAH